MHGRTVVLMLATLAETLPAALLLLQVQTGGIGKEQRGDQSTTETKPGHDVELGLGIDVVVQDGGQKGTGLTPGSGHTVGGGTNGCGEDLGSDKEGDGIGTELVEERAQEVHSLEGLDVLGAAVVVEVESRDDEEDEAEHETNDLHPFATVQLVVDQERGHVVSAQRDADIDQVPQPGRHDRASFGTDNLDELALEELVAVEENIVGEPAASSGEHAESEVLEGQLQRLGIITGDGGLLLGSSKLLASSLHVVGTVVHKPQSTDGGNGEGNTVGPLNSDGGVRVVTTAVVEAEQENDKHNLVEELTPTLHQEGTGDLAATVQTIFFGGNLSRADGVLHTGGGSHGILASNTDTVDEETPSVTDDPAILGHTPGGSQHDKTEKHDHGVLDQTPSTAEPSRALIRSPSHEESNCSLPVTQDSNQDLTHDDTDDLEVVNGVDPPLTAGFGVFPAIREGRLEQRLDVADREEHVTLEAETSTRQDHVAEVPGDGRERVFLHHSPNATQLSLCLHVVVRGDECDFLPQWEIGPVDTLGGVTVVGANERIESTLLMDIHILQRVMVSRHVGPMRGTRTKVGHRRSVLRCVA